MNDIRISGTYPSSVILILTKKFKTWKSDTPKVAKQAEAKRDGVITHKIKISRTENGCVKVNFFLYQKMCL